MNNAVTDWNLIRAFLAVAEQGSLSAAARTLGISQPTLTRHIQQLEAATQLTLFHRTTTGLQLSNEGRRLVDKAEAIWEGVDAFTRAIDGQSQTLSGDVRLSVNEVVGQRMLPSALAAFRRLHPDVQVEVVISNLASRLNRREADIALRMFRPSQPDLIARRLPNLPIALYAHRDYEQAYGLPKTTEELSQHALIGFDNDQQFIQAAQAMGLTLMPSDFAFRTDSLTAQIALLDAGAGITGTHVGFAAAHTDWVPVMPDLALPALEFWLVCHQDLRHSQRVMTLMQFLGDWFADDPYCHKAR